MFIIIGIILIGIIIFIIMYPILNKNSDKLAFKIEIEGFGRYILSCYVGSSYIGAYEKGIIIKGNYIGGKETKYLYSDLTFAFITNSTGHIGIKLKQVGFNCRISKNDLDQAKKCFQFIDDNIIMAGNIYQTYDNQYRSIIGKYNILMSKKEEYLESAQGTENYNNLFELFKKINEEYVKFSKEILATPLLLKRPAITPYIATIMGTMIGGVTVGTIAGIYQEKNYNDKMIKSKESMSNLIENKVKCDTSYEKLFILYYQILRIIYDNDKMKQIWYKSYFR